MSIHLQPPVPLVTLVKTEPPTVIKNEPPEEALEEDINTDIKDDIDIAYHSLSEDLIKSETVLEEILENKHLESVQTQALVVKTENSLFIKTENITQRNKSEGTSGGNVSKGTGQGVVEIHASNEHSSALSNSETDEQYIKTNETSLWEKDKERIKIIKAPAIPFEPHEYTSSAKDKHVCNHCQHAYNTLSSVRQHIKQTHRKLTTIYQCPYCPYDYKSKWNVKMHIIRKHKDTKDIQQFQHHCDRCDYKTFTSTELKRHNLVHLKPEEIEYFYCYHCSYKSKQKSNLKKHIFRHHFKIVIRRKRYHCDNCDYKTYTSTKLKNHKLNHLKPEEIQHFYCYRCSYKSKEKGNLKRHILKHNFKNVKQEKRHHCDQCDYKTYASTNLKSHKLTHLKPEEMQYFYCNHCSYKTKWKGPLKEHIFKHFKNEEIRFHCYICDFVRLRRDLIIEHIRKHFKNRNKYDETVSKYQLESGSNNLKKRCPNNLEDHCSTIHFDDHVNHIKKQKSEQPESTKSFVSRTESVLENSSKICIFQCTYCPTKFPEEHLLKGHLQLHSSIKGIECPICTYKHNKTEILKHLSWHGANGEDPFICPICDLKKRTKENMDDHLKVVHSKAIYQKHDSVCKNKACNGFCQITIAGNVCAQ